jgi:hypothetical protein
MKKDRFLKYWKGLRKNQKLRLKPIPYLHTGTTYAQDGIRITGSRAFVDSVLSRLKDMLKYESEETRLQVSYERSTDRDTGKPLRSYNCYVQVHARGKGRKKKAKKRLKKR